MKQMFRFFLVVLFMTSTAFAQKTLVSVITDRATFTQSPNLIPIGYVQIESGILYSSEKFEKLNPNVDISNISFLKSLVRYGVSDLIELRFGGEYLFQSITTGESVVNNKGLSSMMAGAKFQFLTSENSFMDAALLLELALPFGSSDFKPEKVEPKIIMALSRELNGSIGISGNLGTKLQSLNNKYTNFYGVNINFRLDEKFSLFAENYGHFTVSVLPKYFITAGAGYLHKSNIQVQLYFGSEITPSASHFFIGAGFAMRFPD